MSKTKSRMFSIFKIIALVITIGAIVYRIICNVMYIDSITEYWGSLPILLWGTYLTGLISTGTAFTRGYLTMGLAIGVFVISTFLLFTDGLLFIGQVVSLDDTPFIENGFVPLYHFLLIIASIFHLIGFFTIKKKEDKIKAAA
ncbi:MAG: hypothetical protein K5745_00330 [Saccharofermentans sp.]|nr:hypothetical protein [Saccharofermentans sp.]